MKIKLLASSAVLAGALMASGTASAAPVLEWSWQGTLQNWKDANYVGVPGLGLVSPVLGAIVDSNPPLPNTGTSCGAPCGDGDTTFTFISSDFALNSSVTLSEWEDDVTGQDYYRVNVQNGVGLGAVNSTLRYNISTTHGFFDWAELDTDHVAGTAQVTKKLFDTGSNPNQFVITPGTEFLTLTSNNGDPVSANFGARTSFNVEDKITAGQVTGISNNYIPEPMSLSLFGLGLAALGYSRRRAA